MCSDHRRIGIFPCRQRLERFDRNECPNDCFYNVFPFHEKNDICKAILRLCTFRGIIAYDHFHIRHLLYHKPVTFFE